MWQLIKKDIFIHKNILLGLLAAFLVYLVVGVPTIFLGIVFACVMTWQIFSSDEKRTAQVLLSSLPLTRKQIVGSKYMTALLYISILIILLIVGNIVIQQQQPNGVHLGFVAVVSLLFVAVIYPFSYKFTSKFLWFASVISLGLYLLVLNFFVPNLHDQIRSFVAKLSTLMAPELMFLTCLAAFALYGLSLFVSIKINEKKVF